MKNVKRFLFFLPLVLVIIYYMGPKPPPAELNNNLPSLPTGARNMESYIEQKESSFNIKPNNESHIIWARDSVKERTSYCLLYLHGFSASWMEGYPANASFAKHFGMNAYFPRLASHGLITEDPLIDMTPDNIWESAKEALIVANRLGERVVIMGTSTGGTLALKLAAEFPEYVDGLIIYSPNIRINNTTAFLLSKPWGLQLARQVADGKFRVTNENINSEECQYWYCKYRLEGVVYLQQLIDATMNEDTYSRVTVPLFLGYYYRDEANQDKTVRVDAMLKMFKQLGTSQDDKVKHAFPYAGDHVIASQLTSGSVDEVIRETVKFGEEVLNLKAIR